MTNRVQWILTFLLIISVNTEAIIEPMMVSVPQKSEIHTHVEHGKCEHFFPILSLNLQNVGIRRIDSDFASSPNVSCLSVEDNEIEFVSPHSLRHTPNLLYFNLARNKVPLGNLTDLDGHLHLHTLIVDGNNSTSDVKLEFNNKFPRLLYLYARNCGITDVASLEFAPRLTHLYLSSNNLEDSSLSFLYDAPTTLMTLDLSNCGIRGLNVSNLASIHVLKLDGNRIKRICGKSNCQESSLVLEGATGLRRLSLTNSNLTSIDSDAFDDTEDLLDLDLSYNRIDSIGKDTFERVETLRNLSLTSNLLSEMPDLCGPKSLLYLSLANNHIEVLNNGSFCSMDKLRFLDLSNNQIRTIDSGVFSKQNHLEILKLSNNRITSFPHLWMSLLTSLRELHVDGNRLKTLDDLSLYGFRTYYKFPQIYLQNNSIKKLHTSSLYSIIRDLYYMNVTLELFDDELRTAPPAIIDSGECECDCDTDNEIVLL